MVTFFNLKRIIIHKPKHKTMITKKEFKSSVNSQTYTGWNGHRIKINAFFFDYKQGENFRGYKFMVSANVKNLKKSELLDIFYTWITEQISQVPWYVKYKFANTDKDRFKISLSM